MCYIQIDMYFTLMFSSCLSVHPCVRASSCVSRNVVNQFLDKIGLSSTKLRAVTHFETAINASDLGVKWSKFELSVK